MQQKLEERKYLNEQIINHQRLIFQIFTFSVIAAVAILGWSSQTFLGSDMEASWLAIFFVLAPLVIILPCAFIISAIRGEIFGWGAYIIVFHESGECLGYETVLDTARNNFGRFRESYTSISLAYWFLCVVCCGLFIYGICGIENGSMPCGISAVVIIPIGLLIYWTIKFVNIPSRSNREKLKNEWREAKKELI
jgi:hypothetical protein